MTQAMRDNSNDISADLWQDLSLVLPTVERVKGPEISAYLAGREVSVDEAVGRAADLLQASVAPAIVGLNGLTIEAVREAVALAERLRARLLPLPVGDPIATRMSVMQTATLGHACAADLRVVYRNRGADEAKRAADPVDELIASRIPNALFIEGDDLMAVQRLRLRVREQGAAAITSMTALPVSKVVVMLPAGADARVISQWHLLAAQLQRELRVSVVMVPGSAKPRAAGNRRGVLEVITWQTGLSCATGGVDFADGGPRPCTDAVTLLNRGGLDVVIDTGLSALDSELSAKVKHRIRIGDALDTTADVCFVTPGLRVGLRARVIRFDGVILWLCDDPSPQGGAVDDPVVGLIGRWML